MADLLLGISQSSLLFHNKTYSIPFPSTPPLTNTNNTRTLVSFSHPHQHRTFKGIFTCSVVSSDSKAPTIISNTVKEGNDYQPDICSGGGGDKFGDLGGGGNSGGGGGGGGGSGGSGKSEGEGESSDGSKKKMALPMSLSQKLTLAYAALVGVGGAMGYLKSGSQKSLLAGGLSASVLYYVYTVLPTQPVFASSIGLGLSAALLGVMGTRFKRSGKIFPAGVVSLVSLVMAGGYLHGISRSMH